MSKSSSTPSTSINVSTLERESEKTLEIIESLKDQRGLNFHIHREAIDTKEFLEDKHEREIAAVQEFFGEAGQFKSDVDEITKTRKNNEPRELSRKIASEEDQLVSDMEAAANAVLQVKNLKEECLSKRKNYQKQDNRVMSLLMADMYIILEAFLRDLLFYFSEAYFDVRVRAKKLANRENYEVFHKEIEEVKNDENIQRVLEIIEDDYKSPSNLENKRYTGLEEKILEIKPE